MDNIIDQILKACTVKVSETVDIRAAHSKLTYRGMSPGGLNQE